MRKTVILITTIICILLNACKPAEEDNVITKKGFMLYSDEKYWYFVPAETLDTSNCLENLQSKNLGRGFQFSPNLLPKLSYIQRTFDSIPGKISESELLRISPVEVAFSFEPKYYDLYTSNSKDPKWNFRYTGAVKDQPIEFTYNIFPVSIKRVHPIFCLEKGRTDIHECSCFHREDDPNDYLFKICNYIKSTDRYSNLPCRYGLKSVGIDTLDGQAVTKVELTCCFLGDIAYFDIKTKELISISYGAK